MPSIKEKPEKSKYLAQYLQDIRLFVGISLILAVAVIFGSIRLVGLLKAQTAIGVQMAGASETSFKTNPSTSGVKSGAYVGSKNGKTYYFPWCGTVNRIKDANLVWFQNRAVAEAKGYKPSSVCHGLK